MRFGAVLKFKVPGVASDFRLSRGCRLELIFAITPTNINVAEESVSACSSCEWLVTARLSTAGALSATASESVEGTFCVRPMTVGYASDAKRNGRGMSSAVRASGSSSHDLSALATAPPRVHVIAYDDNTGRMGCSDSWMGETGEKPYLAAAFFRGGDRPISASPRDRPLDLPFTNGCSVHDESFELEW